MTPVYTCRHCGLAFPANRFAQHLHEQRTEIAHRRRNHEPTHTIVYTRKAR